MKDTTDRGGEKYVLDMHRHKDMNNQSISPTHLFVSD